MIEADQTPTAAACPRMTRSRPWCREISRASKGTAERASMFWEVERLATQREAKVDIETLAEQFAGELLAAVPGLPDANPIERGRIITEALLASQGAGAVLKSAFMDDPSFGDLRGGWIQQAGGYGMLIQEHMVPNRMVDSNIVGKSAKSLVEEARAFAACPTSVTESYTPVAGATVAEVISLGDNIELVPWAEVPDVDQKKVFDSSGPHFAFMSSLPVPLPLLAAANMAVRVRSAEYQVLFSSSQEAKEVREAGTAATAEQAARIRDIVRCITLQGERGVAALGNWALFENEIVNSLAGSGFSFNPALFDIAVYSASRDPVALEAESIARLFRCFEALRDSVKDPLRISIDRLNQSLRRPDIVDKAIDLGIALEVMLLHSIDPRERGELRYRSSIRGAMFLGGDKQERLNTFKLLRDAYDLRSKAVHAGALTAESPPKETLEEAVSVCARIAQKLIEQGSFPDWEAEYVIGER